MKMLYKILGKFILGMKWVISVTETQVNFRLTFDTSFHTKCHTRTWPSMNPPIDPIMAYFKMAFPCTCCSEGSSVPV